MRRRFDEANDNEVILNSIYELTHGLNGEGDSIPSFFNINEITDNYGLTEKEVIDIAKANGYNVYRIPGGEDLVNFTVIANSNLSYGDVVKGTEVDIKELGDNTEDSFNVEEDYMQEYDAEYLYRKLKDMTDNFTIKDTLSFNTFEEQIEARKILLKHYNSVETFANNYGNHQVYFIDVDEPKKRVKESSLDDMKVASKHHLVRVINKDYAGHYKDADVITQRLFRSRPEVDRFVDQYNDVLFDMKIDKDEYMKLKNGKDFIGTIYTVIIDKKDESLEEDKEDSQEYRGYKIVYHPKYSLWANMKEYYRVFDPKGNLVGGQKTVDGAKAMIDRRIANREDKLESLNEESEEGKLDDFYRFTCKDAFGDNVGGLFNSVWKYIYSAEDYDDEYGSELEDLIDKLQDDHKVPSEWLGEKVNFAFSKEYVDRHSQDFKRIEELLNDGDWSLVKTEVDKNKVNVIYEDENQIAYTLKESKNDDEVIEETSEYKIVKTIQHNFKTVKGVARKGKDKVIYQVYFRTQDFNPAVNRWMNKGWANSTSDFDNLEDARAYVKKYGKTLKDGLEEDIETKYVWRKDYADNDIWHLFKKEDAADNNALGKALVTLKPESSSSGTYYGYSVYVDGKKRDENIYNVAKLKKLVLQNLDKYLNNDLEEDVEKHDELKSRLASNYNVIDIIKEPKSIGDYYDGKEVKFRNHKWFVKLDDKSNLYYLIDAEKSPLYTGKLNVIIVKDDNLDEDIEKHDKLNPKLFDGNELKPEVKEKIEQIANQFVSELNEDGVHFTLKDIVLLGSNCSYNYTKDSDLDIHLIADSSGFDCPQELYDKLYGAYRSIFNKNYDITLKGIPAEIYVELDEPRAKSNGIYSINNGWIKEPVQQDIPDIDRDAFDKLFDEWEDRYVDLIGNEEDKLEEELKDDIEQFINDIYALRKDSIANEGEYGLGNLVFKELRNRGYLDNLKELRKKEISKDLSLEHLDKHLVEDLSSDDFWNLRNVDIDVEGNLIQDGDKIRPITKEELADKYAVSMEHADKEDFKTREEIEELAKETGALRIMFFYLPGENYSGEYSLLYDDEDKAVEVGNKYEQKSYAMFDENGEYNEVLL